MKKFLFALLAVLLLLAGCGKKEPEVTPTYEYAPGRCTVGITVGETGYYGMFADVALDFKNDALVNVEITNPTLLAFRASERWEGGYYVYSREEINRIIESLEQYDDPELQSLIDALRSGLLMTEAST